MKIDILKAPDADIMRDRNKYALIFIFFLIVACFGIGIGVYEVYFSTIQYKNLDNASLAILVVASLFITYFGEKLQAYKRLYAPHRKMIAKLRQQHPVINNYCSQVEMLKRDMIRAEFLACTSYVERYRGNS